MTDVDRQVVLLGDDLSGVAEATAVLRRHTGRVARIDLVPPTEMPPAPGGLIGVDLDCRRLDPAEAELRTVAGIRSAGPDALVLIKIDSLLRGNVAAQVRAAAGAPGPTVVATALPVAGRTVVGGVPRVPVSGALIDLATVRAGAGTGPSGETLRARMRALAADGITVLCDAETDADLDRIAAVGLDLGAHFVGSAGLVGAVGRLLGGRPAEPEMLQRQGRVMIAVGTTESVASAQLEHLAADPATSEGVTVFRTPALAGAHHDHRAAEELAAQVAREVRAATDVVDLVVTGGETARQLLTALGVRTMSVIGEAHHGAVISTTDQGFRVVTRPGSFGDVDSFVRIVQVLRGKVKTDVCPS